MTRRQFLQSLSAGPIPSAVSRDGGPRQRKGKDSRHSGDGRAGPRTYTLVKVVSDAGLFGIGEAYGNPGAGVKEQIFALKPDLIGKDPLQIDVIYTGLGQRTDGSAHSLMRGGQRDRDGAMGSFR